MRMAAQQATMPVDCRTLSDLNRNVQQPLSRETLRQLNTPTNPPVNAASNTPLNAAVNAPTRPSVGSAARELSSALEEAVRAAQVLAVEAGPLRANAGDTGPLRANAGETGQAASIVKTDDTASVTPAAAPVTPAAAPVTPAAAPVSPASRGSGDAPRFVRLLQKGQRTPLAFGPHAEKRIRACFGWNVRDKRCDVDVSAFFLDASERVPDEGWFLFYGQPRSPDGSFSLRAPSADSQVVIEGDLGRLPGNIAKIVFVVTIHEALNMGLHFGMLDGLYIRLLHSDSGEERFCPQECGASAASMVLGELYQYKGAWRFHPIGGGVPLDLAGLCAVYGVQTI